MSKDIKLVLLEANDREQFITDNQQAFLYGATEEFGLRDDHFEEDGQIISRETIEKSIDAPNAETYRIMDGDKKVGGVVIEVDKETLRGDLQLLFVIPSEHSKGVGYATWCAIEKLHPEIEVWETATPYFEKRNIHFYVNRCGFKIVEFYNEHHICDEIPEEEQRLDEMFRFEKIMK